MRTPIVINAPDVSPRGNTQGTSSIFLMRIPRVMSSTDDNGRVLGGDLEVPHGERPLEFLYYNLEWYPIGRGYTSGNHLEPAGVNQLGPSGGNP